MESRWLKNERNMTFSGNSGRTIESVWPDDFMSCEIILIDNSRNVEVLLGV